MVYGKEIALKEALKIKLKQNSLYYCLLAELYKGNDKINQIECLKTAIRLSQCSNDIIVLKNELKMASSEQWL
jgi:hypothetical protein